MSGAGSSAASPPLRPLSFGDVWESSAPELREALGRVRCGDSEFLSEFFEEPHFTSMVPFVESITGAMREAALAMAVDLELLVTAAKGPAAMAASRTARPDVADIVVDTVARAKRHRSEEVDATFLQPGRLEALRAVLPPVAVGTWPTVLRRSKEPEADPRAREKAELVERRHWGAELLVLEGDR